MKYEGLKHVDSICKSENANTKTCARSITSQVPIVGLSPCLGTHLMILLMSSIKGPPSATDLKVSSDLSRLRLEGDQTQCNRHPGKQPASNDPQLRATYDFTNLHLSNLHINSPDSLGSTLQILRFSLGEATTFPPLDSISTLI